MDRSSNLNGFLTTSFLDESEQPPFLVTVWNVSIFTEHCILWIQWRHNISNWGSCKVFHFSFKSSIEVLTSINNNVIISL